MHDHDYNLIIFRDLSNVELSKRIILSNSARSTMD